MSPQFITKYAFALCIFAATAQVRAEEAAFPTSSSPRMQTLIDAVKGEGKQAAVEAFWKELEAGHTPIVEPIEGDDKFVWLTFIWRGDESTKNVALVGSPGATGSERDQLSQIPGTDIWFKTKTMRNDFRGSYRFYLNHSSQPQVSAPTSSETGAPTFKNDPLNPKASLQGGSYLELQNAPPQPWLKEDSDAPKGKVHAHRKFASTVLKNERQIGVYTPAGFDPKGEPYPLVLLFDLSAYTSLVPTPRILDNLIHAKRIPPVVAVLVGHPGTLRNTELPCNKDFAEFLATELIPFVQQEYHASNDPARNVVGGSSFGGLAASYFAFQHPELIGNVLSQSGSYWWTPQFMEIRDDPAIENEWLTQQYLVEPNKPLRFFIEVGLREGGEPSMVVVNRHFRDILKAKDYEIVKYTEFNGGHEYCNWRGSLADGLIALIGNPE